MSITEQDALQALQKGETLFVAYSQATRLPYVSCDEESFNDQVWIFATEELVKKFGTGKLEEKILLMGMKYETKNFPRLYGLLYSIGVNEVVFTGEEGSIKIEMQKIAKQRDLSQIEASKRPLINPTLQLSGIYFMQEMRRPVPMEQHKNIRDLEEELLVNLMKAEVIVATIPDENDPKKINIPFLKDTKNDKTLQPVFTDVLEFEKFGKNNTNQKYRLLKIPFTKLPKIAAPQANGFAFNPFGFNLVLTKEQIEKITAANS